MRASGFAVDRCARLGLGLALQSKRGPCGIEGHESAADHHHPATEAHPVAAVHVEEVIDGLHDPVELHSGHLQVAALRNPESEEDGLEAVAFQLAQTEGGCQRRSET